jgi:predicted NBD/HSP70 family sugar kinase
MPTHKATHQQTKQHNRDLVLKTIIDHDAISRAEIARRTNLTRATVSDMVTIISKEGLVKEIGYGESIGGKAPILLSLAADSRYLLGLYLAQDKFIGSVVNLRGEIKDSVEYPVNGNDREQALQLVYKILDQLIKKKWKPLVGIGVGTPGLVNTREGVVVNAVNLEWQDLPLGKLLERKYKIPVLVLNDSQATAIGEFVYGGEHPSDQNLIVVNVKHGIGAGILINGHLFQGDGGGAGEIGHVVVQENGELCRCGKQGCLETISSVRAVLRSLKLDSLDKAQASFALGDMQAQQVVTNAAHYLGISLASLIGTLNIQKIILTGDMTCFGALWLEAVNLSMRNAALSRLSENTKLELGKLDYRACILGASAFLLLNGYSLLFQQEN